MKKTLSLILSVILVLSLLSGCGQGPQSENISSMGEPVSSMELDFAQGFSVDYYEGGYKLISISDGSSFLVIPEGKSLPKGAPEGAVPLYQPVERIYMAATAVMCLFDALDGLGSIAFSGSRAENWYVEGAKKAMEEGRMVYAGKYSEPDYEMLVQSSCPLAVESTMINHSSEVKDKLEELGIAVLTDQSSNEPHPLGRTEWIRLYGAILDKEEEADAVMERQKAELEEALSAGKSGRTVAFFYISSSGRAVVRRSGDYVSKMIDLAGGQYAFSDIGDPDSKSSTVTLEMETFFSSVRDADVIIYNSNIDGEVKTLDDMLRKSSLLQGLKAVSEGNVWCTGQNMYQQTTELGTIIKSFSRVFSGQANGLDELPFLYRLR